MNTPLQTITGYIVGLNAQLGTALEELRTAAAEVPQRVHHIEQLQVDVVRLQGKIQGLELAKTELVAWEEAANV